MQYEMQFVTDGQALRISQTSTVSDWHVLQIRSFAVAARLPAPIAQKGAILSTLPVRCRVPRERRYGGRIFAKNRLNKVLTITHVCTK